MQSGYTKNLRAFMRKNSIVASLVFFAMFGTSIHLFAAPPVEPYQPSETLDPTCTPGSANCTVQILPSQTGNTNKLMYTTGTQTAWAGNLFWDNTNSRLGIGTNTPVEALDVVGNISLSGDVLPTVDNTQNIGSALNRFGAIYASNIVATSFSGTFTPAGFTQGSIVFSGTGGTFDQDNANFFWDNTNNRLGLGTATPSVNLDIVSAASSDSAVVINTTSADFDSYLSLQEAGVEKWKFRNQGDSGDRLRIGSATNPLAISVSQMGQISLGSVTASAWLYLPASNGSGQTAPLKFTAGTNIISPETGAVEYNGTQLFFTPASTRNILAQVSGSTALTTGSIPFATTNGYLINDSDLSFSADTLSATKLLSSTSVSTPSLISTGAITATPASGSNFNISLATTGDFSVNTNQLYVDTSAGYVGVGTAIPSFSLDVNGTGRFVGNLRFDAGIRDNRDNTIIAQSISSVASNRDLTIGNATYSNILFPNGNIGIGAITPAYKLDVAGGVRIGNVGSTVTMGLGESSSNSVYVGSLTNHPLKFLVNTNEYMRITTAGNVGIGTSTPGEKLHVYNSIDNALMLKVENPSSGTGASSRVVLSTDTIGQIVVNGANNTALGGANSMNIINNASAPITLFTNLTERMRIDSSGNVGIGTTTPSAKFHVVNTGQFLFNTNNLQIASGGLSAFYYNNAINWSSSLTYTLQRQGGAVGIHINASDNVGIGTSTPSAKLDVSTTAIIGSAAGMGSLTVGNTLGNYGSVFQMLGYSSVYKNWQIDNGITNGGTFNISPSTTNGGTTFTTPALSINTNSNVGIGTSTPGYKLDVNGVARIGDQTASGQLYIKGLADVGQYIYLDNGSKIWTMVAGANYSIKEDANVRFTVREGGNVGIGSATPSAKLHILGTTEQFRLGYDTSNYWTNTVGSTGGLTMQGVGTGGSLTLSPTAGQNLNVSLSGTGDFAVNTNQLYVDTSAGNVGIGTTAPTLAKLQIQSSQGGYGILNYNGLDYIALGSYGESAGTTSLETSGALKIKTGGAVTRMTIESTGNVGIGTTAPGAQLQVNAFSATTVGSIFKGVTSQTADLTQWQNSSGSILSKIASDGRLSVGTGTLDATAVATFRTETTFGGISIKAPDGPRIFFDEGTAGSETETAFLGLQQIDNAFVMRNWGGSGSQVLFAIQSGGSRITPATSTPMTILHNGNVGIGAASSGAMLQINASSASTIGQIVRGAASQTANLTEWQDSTGTVLSSINSSGNLLINGSAVPGVTVRANTGATRSLTLGIGNNGTRAEFAMGAGLTSGFTIVSSNGWNNFAVTNEDGSIAKVSIGNNGVFPLNARLFVNIGTASHVGQVVRGAASQTADLMQWQDSAGTVLSAVDSTGRFTAGGAGANTLTMRSDRAQIFVNGSTTAATGPFIDFDANSTVTAGTTFYRFGTGTMSGALSGNNTIIASNPTINPAAGSGVFRMMDLNYTTNASGAQAGSVTGLRVNRNVRGGSTAFTTDRIVDFQSAGTSLFTLLADGNVGIGTNTPSAKLNIVGNIIGQSSTVDASAKEFNIGVAHNLNSEEPLALITGISNGSQGIVYIGTGASSNAATDIRFFTSTTNTTLSGTERMRIDGSGNVGIGTTSPLNKLDVSDNLTGNGTAGINVVSNVSGSITKYGVWSQTSGATTTNVAGYFTATGATNNYGLIVANGNTGLGTTTPGRKLDILDTSSPQLRLTYTNNSVYTDIQTGITGNLSINPTGTRVTIGSTTVPKRLEINSHFKIYQTGLDASVENVANQDSHFIGAVTSTNSPHWTLNLGQKPGTGHIHENGTGGNVRVVGNALMPSGSSGNFYSLELGEIVNTDATATGISSSLRINPTLTQIPTGGYRAIEIVPNNASAYGIYQSGANTKNYFNGNVGIGTTTPDGKLEVAGTVTGATYGFGLKNTVSVVGTTQNTYGLYNLPTLTNSVTAKQAIALSSGGIVVAGTGITVDNAYSLFADTLSKTGAGTITNTYGLYVNTSTSGTNNYAAAFMNGNVGIGTTAPGAQLQVNAFSAATIGSVFKGATSQTADLTQWQNSAGNVLTRVNSNGDFIFNYADKYIYGLNGSSINMYEGGTGNLQIKATTANTTFSKISFWTGTTSTQRMVVDGSGNVGIGTNNPANSKVVIDASGTNRQGLSATALTVDSQGATSGSNVVAFRDGGGSSLLVVRSDGQVTFGVGATINPIAISTGGLNPVGQGLSFRTNDASSSGRSFVFKDLSNIVTTTGTRSVIENSDNFSPTSGTAIFNSLNIANTINQTGGANGITRGVYINPTLTSAADFRAIETTNNSGYGIYQSGASATNYFAGNVGIGTASPTNKLHLYGAGGSAGLIKMESTTASGNSVLSYNALTAANANQLSGTWDFYTATATTPDFFGKIGFKFEGGTSNASRQFQVHVGDTVTPKMVVNGSGNVGIGTISPDAPLHIMSGTTAKLTLTTSDYVLATTGSRTRFGFGASTGNTYSTIQATSGGGGSVNNLVLQPDGGNIGVGTTSPNSTSRLEVYDGTAGNGLRVTRSSVTSQFIDLIPNNGTESTLISMGGNAKPAVISNRGAWPIHFSTGGDGIANARMTIDGSGNVGVGTTSPSAKFHSYIAGSGTAGIFEAAGTSSVVQVKAVYNNIFRAGTDADNSEFSYDGGFATTYIDNNWPGVGSGGNQYGDIRFRRKLDGSTLSTVMTIRGNNGNVGIGTAVPGHKVDIRQSADGVGLAVRGFDDVAASGLSISVDYLGQTQINGLNNSPFVFNASNIYYTSVGAHYFAAQGGNYKYTMNGSRFAPHDASNNLDLGSSLRKWKDVYVGTNAYIDGKIALGTSGVAGKFNVGSLSADNLIYASTYSATPGHTNYWFSRKSASTVDGGASQTANGDYLGAFYFQGVNNVNAFEYGAKIYARQNGEAGAYIPTDINFSTYSSTAQNLNQFVISNTGNVGIGIEAPDSQLEIYKSSVNAHANLLKLTMNSWASSQDKHKNIVWDDNSNVMGSIGLSYDAVKANMDFHSFYNSGYKTDTDILMRLTGDGRLGIGTTNPSSKLTVQGDKIRLTTTDFNNVDTGSMLQLDTGTATGNTYSRISAFSSGLNSWNNLILQSGPGNVGIGTIAPGYKLEVGNTGVIGVVARFVNSSGSCDINPTTTSLSCSSDQTLKKNITSLSDEFLTKVISLRPVTYNWNAEVDGTTGHIGFIAQEVEQIFPDLVATDSVTGLKSVNYIGFIPYITKAVIEQNVKIGLIEDRVTNLENIINGTPGLIGGAISSVTNLVADTLKVGTPEKRTGITIYDEATGDPFCIKVVNGNMQTVPGECGVVSAPVVNQSPAQAPVLPQAPETSPEEVVSQEPEATLPPQEETPVVEDPQNTNPSNEVTL